MNIVIGIFTPEDGSKAIHQLLNHGFPREDLSVMTSVAEVPQFIENEIEGEPEASAGQGAAVGAAAGSAVGALGAFAASAIPGFETFSLAGLIATAAGGTIGAFLGGLYNTRAETQTYIDLHEKIESGFVLLMVQDTASTSEQAAAIMKENGGQDVEIHDLND